MADEVQQGNKPADYKGDYDENKSREARQVRMWREMIDRASGVLRIEARTETAKQGDQYLDGTKKAMGYKAIHFRYLLPMLEDVHRRSLPRIPTPQISARNAKADVFVSRARELLDMLCNSTESQVLPILNQSQWDDSRFGVGFIRAAWVSVTKPTDESVPSDEEQLAVEIDRALAENDNPLDASVAEGDIDKVHIEVHSEVLEGIDSAYDPNYALMWEHLQEHEARMVDVQFERPVLRRVPVCKFVYDPDVPWPERTWEAEKRSVRVTELLRFRYKNVNKENCPAEDRIGWSDDMPFDLATVQIFEIHNRLTDEFLVISADGPEDGRFLFRGPWPYKKLDDVYYPVIMRPWKPELSYGASTVQACLPILDELAKVDYYIQRHAETHPQYKRVWPSGTITGKVKAALNDPNVLDVEAPAEAMAGSFERKPPPIPDTLLVWRNLLLAELRRVLGADAQDTATPNPHQISATESGHRSEVRAERKTDRQDIMGDASFLVRMAEAEQGETPFGDVKPEDIPEGLDILFDIRGESEEAKANSVEGYSRFIQFREGLSDQLPTKWSKLSDAFGRRMGVVRPEQFNGPPDKPPTPVEPTQFPGMPSESSGELGPQGQSPTPESVGAMTN